MVAIVQKEDLVLRKKAKIVPLEEISSSHIQKVINDMKEALDSQEDGVAIAAPQIGELVRIFVVSKRAFDMGEKRPKEEDDIIFINPVITNTSQKKEWVEEGCLSVRWLYGEVLRHRQVSVSAYNDKGETFERGGSGLLAQIFQHEIDHLDGVLFTDKARNLQEVPPQE